MTCEFIARCPMRRKLRCLSCADSLDHIAKIPLEQRTTGQRLKIQNAFLTQAASTETQQAQEKLVALKQEKARLEASLPTVMVMQEMPAAASTFVLRRGAYDAPAKKSNVVFLLCCLRCQKNFRIIA